MEGRDAATGAKYPAFAMRTFISKCVNHKWGTVSYGGATFRGRIECCTSHLCNKQSNRENLSSDLHLAIVIFQDLVIPKRRRMPWKFVLVLTGAVSVGLLIVAGAIAGLVYRSRQKKTKGKYDSCATTEPVRRVTMGAYPEASAAPELSQT